MSTWDTHACYGTHRPHRQDRRVTLTAMRANCAHNGTTGLQMLLVHCRKPLALS